MEWSNLGITRPIQTTTANQQPQQPTLNYAQRPARSVCAHSLSAPSKITPANGLANTHPSRPCRIDPCPFETNLWGQFRAETRPSTPGGALLVLGTWNEANQSATHTFIRSDSNKHRTPRSSCRSFARCFARSCIGLAPWRCGPLCLSLTLCPCFHACQAVNSILPESV